MKCWQYSRLELSGTPSAVPWSGQLVIACVDSATQTQDWGYATAEPFPQVRNLTPAGRAYVS